MNNDFLNNSDNEFDDDFEEIVNRFQWRLAKRYIRDFQNPIEMYDDVPFRRRYRFSKGAVIELLLPLVNSQLKRLNNRGLPVSPLM